MEVNDKICPVCTSILKRRQPSPTFNSIFYDCPVCGKYELFATAWNNINSFDRNHLAAYLVYHAFKDNPCKSIIETRYHTVRSKEECDKYSKDLNTKGLQDGHPVHMDNEMIEAWYPKSFLERVDQILIYISNHTEHIGQYLRLSVNLLLNVLFVDKQELNQSPDHPTDKKWVVRPENEYIQEANYMLRYLRQQSYIEADDFTELKSMDVVLTPKGYARVEELQKNTSHGRGVLVAMKFGNDTKLLREAIRKGISNAGYTAVFIDEVQHNDFITPELLKHIKDSKFIVVDLTHQNNGAYFEEGYAMGLGKQVIQLCKHDVKLHFDVAQKNTIMWESEDDIPEKLCNRIKATID